MSLPAVEMAADDAGPGVLPLLRGVLVVVLAVVLAFALGALFIVLAGYDAAAVYGQMLSGALTSPGAFAGSVAYAIPVLLTALAASVAFRIGFWNIGADGQLAMGAFASSWVALTFRDLPAAVMLPSMFLAGFVGGALWGLIPASLRTWTGVNEVMTSLLLNYVAFLGIDYLVFGPWRDPRAGGWPNSAPFPDAAWLPTLPTTGVHVGLAVGVVAAVLLFVAQRHTVWGYEVNVIGRSPAAARYAGMGITRHILLVMVLSGGLAGFAGVGEVGGVAHRLFHVDSQGYGYIGILVAWLSQLNPLAIVGVSLLYGVLLQGGVALQLGGLPPAIVAMLQAAIVLFALASPALSARLGRLRPRRTRLVGGTVPTAAPEAGR